MKDRWSDGERPTNRQADRWMDRQTDRKTDKWMEGEWTDHQCINIKTVGITEYTTTQQMSKV